MKKEKYSKCSFKPMQTKKWSCFYLPKNPPFLPVLWRTTRLKPSSMLQLPALILSYLTLPFISYTIRSPIFSESLTLLDDHLPNDLHNPNKSCPSPLSATTFLNHSTVPFRILIVSFSGHWKSFILWSYFLQELSYLY